MMTKKIGIDIDGVLAVFEAGYVPLLTKHSGIEFPRLGQADWPDTWDWDLAAGVTPDQVSDTWEELKKSYTFWYDLPAHDGTEEFLANLSELEDEIYFVTNRFGKEVKLQTELWLSEHGYSMIPTVLVTSDKAGIANALNLTHYIDDKPSNCEQVRDKAPNTHGYMLARPWNHEVIAVPRLNSIGEFFDIVNSYGGL